MSPFKQRLKRCGGECNVALNYCHWKLVWLPSYPSLSPREGRGGETEQTGAKAQQDQSRNIPRGEKRLTPFNQLSYRQTGSHSVALQAEQQQKRLRIFGFSGNDLRNKNQSVRASSTVCREGSRTSQTRPDEIRPQTIRLQAATSKFTVIIILKGIKAAVKFSWDCFNELLFSLSSLTDSQMGPS